MANEEIPLLRTSERSTFKRCPQRWWWSYREGLVPTTEKQGALWFGTGIHLCMAEWYLPGTKRGRPLAETWDEYTRDSYATVVVDEEGKREYEDARELGFAMLDWYMENYGDDPHWDVISPEQPFQTLIPHPNNSEKAIVDYRGTFDMVYRDLNDGKVKMVDHKTAGAISTNHLALDEQASSYLTLATHSLRQQGLIGKREAVEGMEYNFLAKRKPDPRPRDAEGRYLNKPTKDDYIGQLVANGIEDDPATGKPVSKLKVADMSALAESHGITVHGAVSKVQPQPTLLRHFVARTAKERNRQIRRIGEEALVMDQFRDGTLPIIKTPDRSCTWCPFYDLCLIDEQGGDTEEFKSRVFKVRDPYMDHREGADNSKKSIDSDKKTKG